MYKVQPYFDVTTVAVPTAKNMYPMAPLVVLPQDHFAGEGSGSSSSPSLAKLAQQQDEVMNKIQDLQGRLAKLEAKGSAAVAGSGRDGASLGVNLGITIPVQTSRLVLYVLLDLLIETQRVGKLKFHVHNSALHKSVEPFPERFTTFYSDNTGLGAPTDLLTVRIVVADVGRMTITSSLARRSVSGVSALKFVAGLVGRPGLYDENDIDGAVAHDEALDFVDQFAADPPKMLKAMSSRLEGTSIVPGTSTNTLTLADLYLRSAVEKVPVKARGKVVGIDSFVAHMDKFNAIKAAL